MYRFIIPLETPSKKNSRITLRNGKTIPSMAFQEWHENASIELLKYRQYFPTMSICSPVKIRLTFTHGDKKRRDSDNQASSILDLLQDVRLLHDDSWEIVRKLEILNEYEKNSPSVLIEIEEL